MSSLHQNPVSHGQTPAPLDSEEKQRKVMRIALALLGCALLVVMLKNWDFWSNLISPETMATETAAPDTNVSEEPAKTIASPATLTHSNEKKPPIKTPSPSAPALTPVITATNRTVLPPLEIQVVSGNREQNVRTYNRSIQVDLGAAADAELSPRGDGITTNASERVALSADGSSKPAADNSSLVAHKVQPNYPVLAKQMKIQGAVVLEALIGRDGDIQHLRVVTGPTILAAAAREAVKQWHFRPYLAGGKAVETEARITVNFTISAD